MSGLPSMGSFAHPHLNYFHISAVARRRAVFQLQSGRSSSSGRSGPCLHCLKILLSRLRQRQVDRVGGGFLYKMELVKVFGEADAKANVQQSSLCALNATRLEFNGGTRKGFSVDGGQRPLAPGFD